MLLTSFVIREILSLNKSSFTLANLKIGININDAEMLVSIIEILENQKDLEKDIIILNKKYYWAKRYYKIIIHIDLWIIS